MMRSRGLCILLSLVFCSSVSAEDRIRKDVELRGIYVSGHATSTLTPCTKERPMWLGGAGRGGDDLHDAYDASVGADFEPLFVVVRGTLNPDWDIGDYFIGKFVIEELIDYSADPETISHCLAQEKIE